MLQIDHVYEFLYQELFCDFSVGFPYGGVPKIGNVSFDDICIFKPLIPPPEKMFFYDQEPFVESIAKSYNSFYMYDTATPIVVTSEISDDLDNYISANNYKKLYYFYHGFAALDWYRGFYALNYNKEVIHPYSKDFISYNRLITGDRSYRIYFLSQLAANGILDQGMLSFGVADDQSATWQDEIADPNCKLSDYAKSQAEQHLQGISKLIVDYDQVHGSASADIPRHINNNDLDNNLNTFWHVVTETVFYHNKLHLTEKIFKPIVMKQPFMLLGAPGNLEYLRSYGFQTFDSIIDESYDLIEDPVARIDAVVAQLKAFCSLSSRDKMDIVYGLESIIEHNFQHFYGEFRHIITRELLDNTKELFRDIGYNDSHISYGGIYHVLTN